MQGHLISNWFNSTAVYQEHSLLLEQICNFHNDFSHFMAHALQDMTCREWANARDLQRSRRVQVFKITSN